MDNTRHNYTYTVREEVSFSIFIMHWFPNDLSTYKYDKIHSEKSLPVTLSTFDMLDICDKQTDKICYSGAYTGGGKRGKYST